MIFCGDVARACQVASAARASTLQALILSFMQASFNLRSPITLIFQPSQRNVLNLLFNSLLFHA